jgi:phenylalanyl-tRNA synthetase beta chain
MRGVAREMGTGLAVGWRDPGAATLEPGSLGDPAWDVTVADADRCDRFSMIAMEGLDPTAPSPGGCAAGWPSPASAPSPWPST